LKNSYERKAESLKENRKKSERKKKEEKEEEESGEEKKKKRRENSAYVSMTEEMTRKYQCLTEMK